MKIQSLDTPGDRLDNYIRLQFSEECDWWLNIFGVDKTFDDLAKSIPIIRKDISSRAKKREVIFDEVL